MLLTEAVAIALANCVESSPYRYYRRLASEHLGMFRTAL
jgi:hypothetical protein